MKMRKLVAALLAVLMLCSIIPFSAMAASASATITFDSVSKRTEFDTSHQVWQENGITVTNKKDASTSNVADYAKPARFYKNSSLVVEYPGMTKIEFTCNTAAYATALQGAIADATVDGNVVSVSLNGVDSFSCVLAGGQVRVDSITVYGEGGDAPVVPPVEPDVPETPDEPETPASSATIDFTDKLNRTFYSTEQQVWKQNGIIVTNDKGASTSNVGDYGGEGYPARFYKSSTVKIEYFGMTKIVIDCGDLEAKYVDGWTNSFSADATASKDGNVITIELAAAADEFVWETLSAQSRAFSITVYGEGGVVEPDVPVDPEPDVPVDPEPDEPEVPSDPEADTELTIAEAIALALSKAHNVYTEGKYYVTGVITEVYNTQYGNMKITDAAGNILTVYGTYSADGTVRYDALEVKPVAGDTVTVYGIIGPYNGTPQVKNGWITAHTAGETPDVPVEPDVPVSDLILIDAPKAGVAYKFGMIQENVSTSDVYYLIGGMNSYYMATGTDAAAAIDVYLEETTGGYYMYTMVDGAKTYINMVVSGTHVNGAYEAAASTVYTFNADSKTVIAIVNDAEYWFGTRNDKNYTTVGPCAVSYAGFYCQFYGTEGGDTPVEPPVEECTHEYDNACDVDCNLCGEGREVTHTVKHVAAKAATCTENGNVEYWYCAACGQAWLDAEGIRNTNLKAVVLPAIGEHTYDDEYDADCNVCGETREVPEKPVYVGGIATGTNTGAIGDKVNISVQLDGNPGIVSVKVKLHFDNTVLKLVEATPGEFSAAGYSWGDIAAANEKGYFIVNWCDATQPNSTAQMLANLTFEILEGAQVGMMYDILPDFDCQADIFNAADETVWFYPVIGSVMVVEKAVEGDANGDGKVNNRDLGTMQQYLNGWDTTLDEKASDLNGDGKINNRDLGMLQKMLNQ